MELHHCPQCGEQLTTKKEDTHNRLYCQLCKVFVYENPVPVVAGVILNTQGKILLIKRGVEPCIGSWTLPSGFIEINEKPDECIIREIKEETNLDCRIKNLLGAYQQKGWRYKSVIVLAYLLDILRGEPKAGDDAVDIQYFSYEHLPDIPFQSHRVIIEDVIGKKNI